MEVNKKILNVRGCNNDGLFVQRGTAKTIKIGLKFISQLKGMNKCAILIS